MDLVTPIVMLSISLGIIIILREKIRESDFLVKVGIFSIIVSILGNILSNFIEIGFLIQSIAIICVIMSIIIEVYIIIFKKIERNTIKVGMFSLFLFMIFSIIVSNDKFLILGVKFLSTIDLMRILSVISILACILIEVFKMIFKKEEKLIYKEEIVD